MDLPQQERLPYLPYQAFLLPFHPNTGAACRAPGDGGVTYWLSVAMLAKNVII